METKTTILITLALIATGCATNTGSTSSASGVQIEEFTVTDNTLNPSQEANIRLQVANHNKNPTNIETVEIFNKGELTVENKECSSSQLRAATDDLKPRMECSWTVKAPGEEFLEGFDSRPTPIKLRLGYETSFENNEPFKIDYQNLGSIDESNDKTLEFGNGEIKVQIEGETPTDRSNPSPLNIKIENTGPGRIEGSYQLDYTPESILGDCLESKEPVIEDTAEFTCTPGTGSTGTKNLFITTEYKYIKSPNLNIKVEN